MGINTEDLSTKRVAETVYFASDKKQIKTKDYATHCSNDVTRQRSGNKTKLAENLCNTLIETLGVDAKFVSVSVEDVEMKEWEIQCDAFRQKQSL